MPKKKKPWKKPPWDNGVRATESGKWEWQIMIGYKDDGKPLMAHGTCNSKTEAREARRQAKTLPVSYSPNTTIADWGDAWYKERLQYVRVTGEGADEINERDGRYLEESSYANNASTLAWIKRAFPDDKIGHTTPDRIKTGIMALMKPDGTRYKFGTYQKMRSMLDQMYNSAEVKGIITEKQNPMYKMGQLHNSRHEKKTTDGYEMSEVQTILEHVIRADTNANDTRRRWLYALAVGLVAGYREQEAVPLMDIDIEPDGSAIQVNKATKRGTKARMYLGGTKSAAGERMIELPSLVWRYAKWLRDHATKGYVFYSPKTAAQSARDGLQGTDYICWVHTSTYVYNVRKILEEIDGIRVLPIHQAQRHTKITLDKDSGVDERVGMAQSGHSDRKVYAGYDHVHRSVKRAAAEKVDKRLKDGKASDWSDYSI